MLHGKIYRFYWKSMININQAPRNAGIAELNSKILKD
jgi:hypothetical protein